MSFDVRLNKDITPAEPADVLYVGACSGCETRWQGEAIAHCAVCHLTFTTVGNFDYHLFRNGCRTQAELRDKGYEPNEAGHWRKPMPEGQTPWDKP
jgi:hypothetical protein